ncbi:MAG: HD domain-containing protein [Patescibacteria group bacterium]
MQFSIPDEVKQIIKTFEDRGFEIYIVGGSVRDLILGRMISDWDFTTNATPEEMQKFLDNAFYDNKFGTVGAPSSSGLKPHEITTFRTEHGYSDQRHPDKISWGKTLKEDLQRRDFTINAIALSDKIIDPYDGQKDLEKKLIRAVGDPHDRFSEDALRMMRAVRIASELGFKIEEKTLEAIKNNCSLINKIAKERVRDEILKLLASPNPAEGILLLRDSGLLQEILPELEKTFGVEQKSPGRHHIYDVGTHSINALKFCKSTDPITRFATLIHDIGKPQTYKVLPTGTITFYNHEVVGTQIAKRIAERLKLSNKQAEKLVKLVEYHQFTVNENQTDSAIRRFIRNVGKEYLEDMLALRVGDRLGGGATETSWRLEEFKKRLIEVQKQPFSIKDLKINGTDVMKELDIKPGPKVGKILEKLFKEVIAKELQNNKEELTEAIKKLSN